jgi:outer membrane receptor protein involved in Fe transport
LGANNLFNKHPPILGSNADFSGNTYPNTYDILGRDFFVSADMHF